MMFSQRIDQMLLQWFKLLTILFVLKAIEHSSAYPTGSVLKITPHCSTLKDDEPYITVVSDLNVAPRAKCANAEVAFQSSDGINFRLNGTFKNTKLKTTCQFTKSNKTLIYTITVVVPWGEDSARIQTHKEFQTITCIFDDYGSDKTQKATVQQSGLAPREITVNTGNKLPDSDFQLQVVNSLKKPYVGAIPQGKKVALMVTAKKAVGLHVMSCEARPDIGSPKGYRLIKSGCGDGRIIRTNAGFTTSGNVALSPYFPMFELNYSKTLQFHCNVTICTAACDGSSCAIEKSKSRKKRSADEEITTLISKKITIVTDDEFAKVDQ